MDEKTNAKSGARRIQRDAEKAKLLQKIKAIREGHATGGYIDSEALKAEEKKLDPILREELAEAIEQHGQSADPRFKHEEVRRAEVALGGLSWKPKLVVASEQ